MIYCLCGSIIFMVIIMIVFLSEIGKYIDEDGNPILTSQHLRGMYIDNIIDERYNKIRNYVYKMGKTESFEYIVHCLRPNTLCSSSCSPFLLIIFVLANNRV